MTWNFGLRQQPPFRRRFEQNFFLYDQLARRNSRIHIHAHWTCYLFYHPCRIPLRVCSNATQSCNNTTLCFYQIVFVWWEGLNLGARGLVKRRRQSRVIIMIDMHAADFAAA